MVMNFTKTGLLAGALAAGMVAGAAQAAVTLFDLSTATATEVSHSGPNGTNFAAGSRDVGIGTFVWGSLATDGSTNTAEFSSTGFESSDWGGTGTFTSDPIDVSLFDDLSVTALFSGGFNSGSEFSNFFYILDSGSTVVFGRGLEDDNYNGEDATGLAPALALPLDVSSASSLEIGFTFNHNGGSDSFDVNALVVSGTPIPEPATLGLCGLGGLMLLRRVRGGGEEADA